MIELKDVISQKDILEVEIINDTQVIAITDYRTVLLDTNIMYGDTTFKTSEEIQNYLLNQE